MKEDGREQIVLDWPIEYFLVFPLVLAALLYFTFGLRGLLRGRPIVVSTRWWDAWALSLLIPVLRLLIERHDSIEIPFRVMLGIPVVILLSRLWRGGYDVLGIRDASLRDALRAVFRARDLAYTAHLGRFRVTSLSVDFKVHDGFLMIELRPCTWSRQPQMRSVARALNEYFTAYKVLVNSRACAVELVIGAGNLLLTALVVLLHT